MQVSELYEFSVIVQDTYQIQSQGVISTGKWKHLPQPMAEVNQKPADDRSSHLAPHECETVREHTWEKAPRPDALSREAFAKPVRGDPVTQFSVSDTGKHLKSLNSNSHSKSTQNLPEENPVQGLKEQ